MKVRNQSRHVKIISALWLGELYIELKPNIEKKK